MKRWFRLLALAVLNLLTATVAGWFRSWKAHDQLRMSRVLQNDADAVWLRRVVVGHVRGCWYVVTNRGHASGRPPTARDFTPLIHQQMPSSRVPFANRWGFGSFTMETRFPKVDSTHAWALPYWLLVILFAPWPAIVIYRRLRHGRRYAAGKCPKCGYDLRATPEQCPECGTEATIHRTRTSDPRFVR